jgi:glutathione peroxidase
MKKLILCAVGAALVMGGCISAQSDEPKSGASAAAKEKANVLNFKVKTLAGEDVNLEKYKGKVVLFVNVASKCGNTPQYAGLQKMHEKYKDQGLAILGFPANNFRGQEPGSDSEIAQFCKANYGVTFDMFSKISVKGDDIHPLYKTLTSGAGDEKLAGDVDWNFAKFLVGRDGKLVSRFSARTKPDDAALVAAVESELAKK